MTLNRIFVYGTLCQGYAGHHLVAAELETPPVEACLPAHRLYNAGTYPLMDTAADHTVKGQILTIAPSRLDIVLTRLDKYEQAHEPNPLYHRVEVTAHLHTDPATQVRAWTYRLNPTYWDVTTLPPIADDDWRRLAEMMSKT